MPLRVDSEPIPCPFGQSLFDRGSCPVPLRASRCPSSSLLAHADDLGAESCLVMFAMQMTATPISSERTRCRHDHRARVTLESRPVVLGARSSGGLVDYGLGGA
jgi:hypothetical protein